ARVCPGEGMAGVRSLRRVAFSPDTTPPAAAESVFSPDVHANCEEIAAELPEALANRADDELQDARALSVGRIEGANRRRRWRADRLARQPATGKRGVWMARSRVGLSVPLAKPVVLSAGGDADRGRDGVRGRGFSGR